MKKSLLYSLFLAIGFAGNVLIAQDFNQLDSLNKLYVTAKTDSDKVVLLTKISVHYWYNNPDTSILIAKEGQALASKIGFEIGIANSLHVMGYAYSIKGHYAAALDCNLQALKIRERVNDKKGLERSFNNIGNIYLDKKDYETADFYYQKGLVLAQELQIFRDIALLSNNIGRLHYFKKEYEASLEYYYRALEISKKNNYKFEQTISLLNLGRSYVALQNFEKAEAYLNKGLELAEQMKNKEKISMALNSLAEIATKRGKFAESISLGKKALEAAQAINSLQYMTEAGFQLFENYSAINDYRNSLTYYRKATEFKDSMFNNEKLKEIGNLRYQFDIEKQQNEIQILERDKQLASQSIRTQRIMLGAVFLVVVFMIIIAWVIYRSREKERHTNVLLREQKNEIEEKNEELSQLNEEIRVQNENLHDLNSELHVKNDEISEQNQKISAQSELIRDKNKRITSSIEYAGRIQKAMLPTPDIFNQLVKDYFILYKPKDIVSGDFFWYRNIGDYLYIAVADCTGHGVPGAFISMLGISLLSETIGQTTVQTPAEVLNQMREQITKSLNQTGQLDEAKDGMDIALLLIDLKNFTLQFAGAYNPLYIIRPNEKAISEEVLYEFIEVKSDRMPVGIYHKKVQEFNNYKVDIRKGDRLYIFSDGYLSQFGGERGETLKTKRFQEFLLRYTSLTMQQQLKALETEFEQWSGTWDQVDDVLVMGVKF